MNPAVKPGDTIRVVRTYTNAWYEFNGALLTADGLDSEGDLRACDETGYPVWVSEWELVTPAPDPLTHLTDHVGSPATLTVAGRTYTATLAHAHEHVKFERGTAIRTDSTIRVELTDIKGQA